MNNNNKNQCRLGGRNGRREGKKRKNRNNESKNESKIKRKLTLKPCKRKDMWKDSALMSMLPSELTECYTYLCH